MIEVRQKLPELSEKSISPLDHFLLSFDRARPVSWWRLALLSGSVTLLIASVLYLLVLLFRLEPLAQVPQIYLNVIALFVGLGIAEYFFWQFNTRLDQAQERKFRQIKEQYPELFDPAGKN